MAQLRSQPRPIGDASCPQKTRNVLVKRSIKFSAFGEGKRSIATHNQEGKDGLRLKLIGVF
jgi:hypothetical protein